jgi:endo-beta-N-acetylglucosaminidase D
MKKILLMITMVLGISILAQAQTKERQHKTPEQRAERVTGMLQKKLSLSADQSVKVKAILLTQATQMQSLRANKDGDRKTHREAFKAQLQKTDSALAVVFTPEQNKTYGAFKAQLKERFKGGHKFMAHNRRGGIKDPAKRAERMTGMLQKKLNLDESQSAKVKAIFVARAAQMDSLRAKNPGDHKANHEAFKTLKQDTDKQLQAVLTADQLKTYTEFKAQMKERHKGNRDVMAAPKEG